MPNRTCHFTLHRRHRTSHGLRIILKSFVRDLSEDFVCPMTSATNILFAASKHSFLMKFPHAFVGGEGVDGGISKWDLDHTLQHVT